MDSELLTGLRHGTFMFPCRYLISAPEIQHMRVEIRCTHVAVDVMIRCRCFWIALRMSIAAPDEDSRTAEAFGILN